MCPASLLTVMPAKLDPELAIRCPSGDPMRRGKLPFPIGSGLATLFELNHRALILKLLLELGGFFLVDAFLDGLTAGFDQVLRLLEAEARDRAHLLDDVDFLFAAGLEDDGKFRLLLDRRRGAGGRRGGNGHWRCSGDAPLLFQKFGELRRLQDGQLREIVDDSSKIGHDWNFLCFELCCSLCTRKVGSGASVWLASLRRCWLPRHLWRPAPGARAPAWRPAL